MTGVGTGGRRVAVVTGAAGAIGSAITTRLQARGFHVVAVDVSADGLAALPGQPTRLPLDLTSPTMAAEVVAVVDELGGCDLLVNNAGIVVTAPLAEITPEESRREQLVNLQAPMDLSRALYPHLTASRGRIVSVVSLGAMMPLAESAGYSASKAGLRAYMLGLAMMSRQSGVGIAMVHPGAVDTPMLRHEATEAGSALNFLGEPLAPGTVADAVVANLDRLRLETFLPRHDGVMLKLVGLAPGVLPRLRPLLERLAQPGRRRYLARGPVLPPG